MKLTFLTFVLAGATFTVMGNTPQLKGSPDKPWRIYRVSDTQETNYTMHEWCSVSGPNTNWDIQHLGGDMSYDTLNVNHYDHNWSEANGGDGSYRNYIREGLHFNRQVIYNTNYGVMVWTNANSGTEIDTDQFGRVTTNSIGRPTIGDEHCKVNDPWNPVPSSGPLNNGDMFTVTHTEQYTRTADTVWHVQTGGMAIPGRKNLWQFSGSAWEIPDKRAVPPFYLPNLNEVTDKTQIVLKELGALKADGNLWLTLPDGADKDITPTLAGNDFYTFNVSGQKYTLLIQVNNNGFLPTTIATAASQYCVGQKMTFAPYWLPSTPPYNDAVAHWMLPATFVNEKHYSYCAGYYDEDTSLLSRVLSANGTLSTFCWYVSGLQAGTASVALDLFFPNGQTVFVKQSGQFNMYRPSVSNFVANVSGATNNIDTTRNRLALGDAPDNGMGCWFNISSAFSGTAGITQTFDDSSSPASVNAGTNVLDSAEFYPNPSPPTISVHAGPPISRNFKYWVDAPWNALIGTSTTLNVNFRDYIRFCPDAGPGPNIFITIGKVTWNVNSEADFLNGVWQLNSNTPLYISMPSLDANNIDFPYWSSTH